jgi:hypothetical protein
MQQNIFEAVSIRILSPDGEFTVIFTEDNDGEPFRIDCYAGKTGTSVRAWADAFCTVISMQLEKKAITLEDIARSLISVTTDKSILSVDSVSGNILIVRSGPEAIGLAIQSYLTEKFLANKLADNPLYGKDGEYLGYLIPKHEIIIEDDDIDLEDDD